MLLEKHRGIALDAAPLSHNYIRPVGRNLLIHGMLVHTLDAPCTRHSQSEVLGVRAVDRRPGVALSQAGCHASHSRCFEVCNFVSISHCILSGA